MEKTIKQSILSLIFEYILSFLVTISLSMVSVHLFFELATQSVLSHLKSKEEVIVGIWILIIVYFSYLLYQRVDNEIIQAISRLIEKIKHDDYSEPLPIAELDQIQQELALQKQKIAEKDAFLKTSISYVGHDMKTPITVIDVNADLITKDNPSEDNLVRIRRIKMETARIAEYIDQLLDVTTSLTENHVKEDIPLADYLKNIRQHVFLYSDSIEETIEIRQTFERTELLYIIGQIHLLEKCLIHLLNNAFEHRKEKVWLTISRDHRYLTISVCDDGGGFSEESLKRATEIFYTSNYGRTAGKGYGIGLYYVNSYMLTIGGQLKLYNQSDGGACAEMHIPLYEVNNDD